jgi:hypothetical protein
LSGVGCFARSHNRSLIFETAAEDGDRRRLYADASADQRVREPETGVIDAEGIRAYAEVVFLRIVVPAGVGAQQQPAACKVGHVEPPFDRPVIFERASRPHGDGALPIEQLPVAVPASNGEATAGREAAELQMKAVGRREQRGQPILREPHPTLERVGHVGNHGLLLLFA